MSVCAYDTNLTCTTTNCQGYSITGCVPFDYINESCFTSQYCDRFLNCTLINEIYTEYYSNYTCYDTAVPSTTLQNNSLQLTPKLFMFILILWALSYI